MAYDGSDKENDDEDENDHDHDPPTVKEILYTALQEQDFATENRRSDNMGGVEEIASEERAALLTRAGQCKAITQVGV
jgi:hypothetical protein